MRGSHAGRWVREVTHICRYWRATALASAQLWTMPDFCQPRLAGEMLRRAGSSLLWFVLPMRVPFYVKHAADRRHFDWSPTLNIARNALHRHFAQIRILEVHHIRYLPLITHLERLPPLLDTLVILNPEHDRQELPVPSKLCQGMRSLRILTLLGCALQDWRKISCDRMTSLALSRCTIPSLSDLLNVLGRAPELRYLDIWNVDKHIPLPHGAYRRTINLPRLRFLSLRECAPTCAELLSHLVCSFRFAGPVARHNAPNRVSITCLCQDHENGIVEFALTDIMSWIAGSFRTPIVHLYISGLVDIALRQYTSTHFK